MDDHPHPLAAARDVLAALLFHMVPSGGRWFQQQRVFFFSGNKSLLLRAGKSIVRAVAAVLMSALKHESEPELLLGYTAFLHAVATRFDTVPPGQGSGEEGQPSKLFLLQLALRVCDVLPMGDIIADRMMAPLHTVGGSWGCCEPYVARLPLPRTIGSGASFHQPVLLSVYPLLPNRQTLLLFLLRVRQYHHPWTRWILVEQRPSCW